MKSKSFYLIGALAVIAAVAAWWVGQQRAPQTRVSADGALVPGLGEQINEVEEIVITTSGGVDRVTLQRADDAWRVAQRGGYRADLSKVRKFLIDVSEAMLVERKSARAENYPALGVQAITDDNASGVQITLNGLTTPAQFIVGKSARGSAAAYVRRSDDEASWVASRRLNVDQDPAKWLVTDLIDVNASRVARITITQPDGSVLDATRNGTNFDVADVPEGRTLSSPSVATELAEVFNNLKFDDVTPAAEFDAGDAQPVSVVYTTSDGLVIDAKATAANNEYYLSLETSAVLVSPDQFEGATTEDSPDVPTPEEKATAMLNAISNQSADINARVSGWVFTIPLFKYEQLSKTKESLLADAET